MLLLMRYEDFRDTRCPGAEGLKWVEGHKLPQAPSWSAPSLVCSTIPPGKQGAAARAGCYAAKQHDKAVESQDLV